MVWQIETTRQCNLLSGSGKLWNICETFSLVLVVFFDFLEHVSVLARPKRNSWQPLESILTGHQVRGGRKEGRRGSENLNKPQNRDRREVTLPPGCSGFSFFFSLLSFFPLFPLHYSLSLFDLSLLSLFSGNSPRSPEAGPKVENSTPSNRSK